MPAPSVRTEALNDPLTITWWQGSSAQPGFWGAKVRDGFIRTCNLKLCMRACVLSHVWLCATCTDCSPPGSRITQARILEQVAISFSRGPSWPRDWTQISWQCLLHCQVGYLPPEPPGKPRTSDWCGEKFDNLSRTWEALSLRIKLLIFVL